MFKKVIGVLATVAGLLSGSVLNLTDAQSKYMDQYCMPDPQVWGMIKHGGLTPDLYTGTVRAEIPIYTYTDPDFEIPVSLTYASNGYMPNTQANFCGLGWSLNAGGCITRRVQGERDDLGNAGFTMNTMGDISLQGYYDYVAGVHPHEVGYGDHLFVDDRLYYYYKSPYTNLQYETEPDVFMFSFLSYSGKFSIGPSGDVIVYDSNLPSGEITVDLSEFDREWSSSRIRIKTGDGYEYIFGGLTVVSDSVLMTRILSSTREYSSTEPVNCDSWYLMEIISPNGRTVTFTYKIDDETRIQTYEPGASYSQNSIGRMGAAKDAPLLSLNQTVSLGQQHSCDWVTDRTKNLALPVKIDVDGDFEISFSYSGRKKETGIYAVPVELATPVKLSSITALDKVNGTEIRSASLEYSYPSEDGNQVLMLSKVSVPGLGYYGMEYFHESGSYPYQGCCAIDHWGFYNSSNASSRADILPSVSLDKDYVETVKGSSRNPDPQKSLFGMLRTLKYPTGGHTRYEYEAHDYSRIVVRNSLTRGHFRLDDLQGKVVAGGLRLKEVVDSASTGVVSRRLYEYETETGMSSGIMMNFPRYAKCAFKDTVLNGDRIYQYVNEHSSSCPGYLLDNIYLGYSAVREVYGDGSSKVTRFTSWEEYPDMLDDNDPAPDPDHEYDIPYISFNYPRHYHNLIRVPTSAASLRGKVMAVEHYGADGTLLKTEVMEYDADWNELDYLKSVKMATDSTYIHHTICESPRLSCRKTVYPDGTVKREGYTYNDQNQLRSSEVSDCGNISFTTYYFHPQDIPSGSRSVVEQEMVTRNRISDPVYVVNTRGSGTSSRITSSVRTLFKKHTLGTLTMFVKESESMAEIPSDLSAVPASADAVLTGAGSLVYRTMFTWNDYNAAGRPCRMTDVDGVQSLLLWGYGGLYPVALMRNLTPEQLSGITHAVDAHKSVLGWNGMDALSETAFRAVSNSAVTVWGWKPFVGISKKTGPDGRTTSWSYDEYGRLESVTGPDGNKISEYRYNIK